MAPTLEALRLERGQPVLERGAETGHNTALVKYRGRGGRLTTVDLVTAFARRARDLLATAGCAARVRYRRRPGWLGHADPVTRSL